MPIAKYGYLYDAGSRGVFDAQHGLVDITQADVIKHNNQLALNDLRFLRDSCKVGDGRVLYLSYPTLNKPCEVTTFNDLVIASGKQITLKTKGDKAQSVSFTLNGRCFEGVFEENSEAFMAIRVRKN